MLGFNNSVDMRRWLLVACAVCCARGTSGAEVGDKDGEPKPDLKNKDDNCLNCEKRHIVNVDEDFNKLKADPELKKHVSAILERLQTFKIPVHPRIRVFHELLKLGMSEHALRTADSLYVPDKYNVQGARAGH